MPVGVLEYRYIDHTAGLSFEILAYAKLEEGNNILFLKAMKIFHLNIVLGAFLIVKFL